MGRLFIGREKHSFRTLDSTNNFAAKLLSMSNPVEGTVIMAQHQTAGKGQRSKTWNDEPGKNLLMSVILKPNFLLASEQSKLNKLVALSVYDTVSEFCSAGDAKIKWPNDILVDNEKIAGILIENTIRFKSLESSIIGIGLNVMQRDFGHLNATSLILKSHRPVPIDIVAERLMNALEHRYLELRNYSIGNLEMEYIQNLYGLNETKLFMIDNQKVHAEIKGVNQEGKLILLTNSGEKLECANGEIIYLS